MKNNKELTRDEIQNILDYLKKNVKKLCDSKNLNCYVAGSFLSLFGIQTRKPFSRESDIDIFMYDQNVEHIDLTDFLEEEINFKNLLGVELNFYPTRGFIREPKIKLENLKEKNLKL